MKNIVNYWLIPGLRSGVGINEEMIKNVLHNYTRVHWSEICGKSRSHEKDLTLIRQLICYILTQQPKHFRTTPKKMGKLINRNRTTIINSVKVVKNLIETKDETLLYYLNLFKTNL